MDLKLFDTRHVLACVDDPKRWTWNPNVYHNLGKMLEEWIGVSMTISDSWSWEQRRCYFVGLTVL